MSPHDLIEPSGTIRDRERERDQAHDSIERDTNIGNGAFGTGIMSDKEMGNVAVPRRLNTDIPRILPHEKVFPIQIGNQLFRLSGASISSDAPSYFSQFFVCQLRENGDDPNSVRTLYIDRDPVTFSDISLHLQGYHVAPRDSSHFVKLFADAQFYSLPRLMSQLYEESIFITIGSRSFRIPRSLLSTPGNSPNFFSLGFAVFFSNPTSVFPGLDRTNLLRPPSILPPSVPNRSAAIFSDLLHMLQGYDVEVRSEEHRRELVRDCKYFHFKGLEQRLVRCEESWNLARGRKEIVLRLEDVRQSGISVVPEASPLPPFPSPNPIEDETPPLLIAYVHYARPYLSIPPCELVLEIGDECTKLHFSPNKQIQAEFFNDGKARIARLFEVIATKLNLPTTQPLGLPIKSGTAGSQPPSPGNTASSGDWVSVEVGEECDVCLDGGEWMYSSQKKDDGDDGSELGGEPSRKRQRMDSETRQTKEEEKEKTWVIKTAQWRLKVRQNAFMNPLTGKGGPECILVGVKINAVRAEHGRNKARGFLGS